MNRKKVIIISAIIRLSICAGICISLGCMAFLLSPVKIIGSVLFSVGLIGVLLHGLKLFTGTVCSAEGTTSSAAFQITVLFGNLAGTALAAAVFTGCMINSPVADVVAAKLAAPAAAVFCKAIFCNVLICLAADEWKTQKNTLMVIFAVTVFVFCGFEHCVANAFYMLAAGNFSVEFFLLCVLGNAVGGIGFWRLKHGIS